jgi:hypothetical protein
VFDRISILESNEIDLPGNPPSLFYFSDPTLVSGMLPVTALIDPNDRLYLGFESAGPAGIPGPITYGEFPEENGVPTDATHYLDLALVGEGYTASFVSNDVPEPASLCLFGLWGIALLSRRRQ